ncbi:MAG: diguanylate cyclase [Rhodospirillaceae bacterium]|nr:diguanylate cyclase [Rhodospirillaceae bacterium]
MTGLGNRQAFDISMIQAISRFKRTKEPFFLILMDVDKFKPINDTKGLLIGEGARPELVAGIRQIALGTKGILVVNELRTLHLGPADVLVNISLDFADSLDSADVEATVSAMERQVKETFPDVSSIFIEAQKPGS